MNDRPQAKVNRRNFLRLMAFGWFSPLLMNKPNGSAPVGQTSISARDVAHDLVDVITPVELVVELNTRATTLRVKNGKPLRTFREFGLSGIELNEAVIQHLGTTHNLLIGRMSAERINLDIGSALPLEEERTWIARGRNLADGMPHSVEVNSIEIRQAIAPIIEQIVYFIAHDIPHIPDEYTGGKPLSGIVLTGEFGQLKKLDQRLQAVTGLQVTVVPRDLA